VLSTPPLVSPEALCVTDPKEAWTYYREGPQSARLAVIDQGGTRLQTLTLNGAPLKSVLTGTMPDPPSKLSGCAFDYYGNVIATDIVKSCLRKFDKDLQYLSSFGSEGEGDYQFFHPHSIAINKQLGQVVVAEDKSAHYFWVGADALGLNTVPVAGGWKFPFLLTERAYVTAEVKHSDGRPVTTLLKDIEWEEGNREISWTPDPALPNGFYNMDITIMATYSSRERIAKQFSLTLKKSKP
jgi:hypothetical protein